MRSSLKKVVTMNTRRNVSTETAEINATDGSGLDMHNLKCIIDKMKKIADETGKTSALSMALQVIEKDPRIAVDRLFLEFPFNLMGVQSKIDRMKELTLATGWVVFLNQAGSLAHVMHADDTESGEYFRVRIPSGLHKAQPEFMRRWFFVKLNKRLVI